MEDVAGSPGNPRPAAQEDRTEVLVSAAQRRDPGALDALIGAHLDDLRAFVRLQVDPQVRIRESCSDVVQSVCREVLEDLPRFDYRGAGAFRAWLFTAALNKVKQKGRFHRAQKRDVAREVRSDQAADSRASQGVDLYASLCSGEPTPSQHAIAHEQAERIERAMDRLPDDQREVLLLARVVRLPHKEIAVRMGRTESAVRTLVNRASVRLLAALEERV